jgi:pimeloyl-ACP methyl ester carboxylesterase
MWLAGTATVLVAMSWKIIAEPVELRIPDGTLICGTLYRPKSVEGGRPVAVVVHGTALAHQSCAPGLAVPLAQNGYLALAIDLRGHGHSGGQVPRRELEAPREAAQTIGRHPEIDTAIDFLKQHPLFVRKHVIAIKTETGERTRSIDRIALVGHSRGGWAVASVGYCRDDVDSVVSIGMAPGACDVNRPRNLLILTGGQEELCPMKNCVEAIAAATGGAIREPSQGFGEFWAGTARRLLLISGVSHLMELADTSITRSAVQWLGSSLDIDAGPVRGEWLTILIVAVVGASVGGLVACCCVAAWTARRLFPPTTPAEQPWRPVKLAGLLVWILVCVPAAACLADRVEVGPVYFVVPAMVLFYSIALGCRALAGIRFGTTKDAARSDLAKETVLGLLMLGLGFVWLGLPWGNSWAELMPDGRRLVVGVLLMAVLLPASLALCAGLGGMLGGNTGRLTTRLAHAGVWLGIALTLWSGYVLLTARNRPLFAVPAGFLAAGFIPVVPLWLAPNRSRRSLAQALCHAGATAWLLACHLPFVQ